MNEEEFAEALAYAFDRGFSAGESYANWGSDSTRNPYRSEVAA